MVSNVPPIIRLSSGAERDEFDELFDRMQDLIVDLRCGLAAVEAGPWEKNEEISCGVSLIRRTHRALEDLRSNLEKCQLRKRAA